MPTTTAAPPVRSSLARTIGRVVLGALLAFTGISHFTVRDAFDAQVPPWMPFTDAVIYGSGVAELLLAAGLFFAPSARRPLVGWALAAFFLVIFPGNISQYVTGNDEFGMDSGGARFFRLLLQPVLILWALWCTGAWAAFRERRSQ